MDGFPGLARIIPRKNFTDYDNSFVVALSSTSNTVSGPHRED